MTQAETMWTGKTVLVTGGASFIGSTLADRLIERGAKVRVVDDLTSGHLGNIAGTKAAPCKCKIPLVPIFVCYHWFTDPSRIQLQPCIIPGRGCQSLQSDILQDHMGNP